MWAHARPWLASVTYCHTESVHVDVGPGARRGTGVCPPSHIRRPIFSNSSPTRLAGCLLPTINRPRLRPSSSASRDAALFRRKHGFDSRWAVPITLPNLIAETKSGGVSSSPDSLILRFRFRLFRASPPHLSRREHSSRRAPGPHTGMRMVFRRALIGLTIRVAFGICLPCRVRLRPCSEPGAPLPPPRDRRGGQHRKVAFGLFLPDRPLALRHAVLERIDRVSRRRSRQARARTRRDQAPAWPSRPPAGQMAPNPKVKTRPPRPRHVLG